jgi:hypothetical protein
MRAGVVAQVVQHLLAKCKILSSTPTTAICIIIVIVSCLRRQGKNCLEQLASNEQQCPI